MNKNIIDCRTNAQITLDLHDKLRIEGDLVGAEKAMELYEHLQSEIEWLDENEPVDCPNPVFFFWR